MPKSLYIDPNKTLRPEEHKIVLPEIPVMQYNKTIKDELGEGHFTKEDLLRIYHDMFVIREFETMLNLVKTTGGYNGVEYNNPGPAHLSAGQEAAAVGMAYNLDTDDFIFGSHRSHGEILAKGLRSIQILPDEELEKIMNGFWDGATVAVAKTGFKGTTKELGIRFLLYGAMAEIFARTTGFNKGLGGSMHTFFTPFGIYPNNAIVGGSPCIAAGAALYKKNMKAPGIVVANGGDGSLGCGPVWEALNFSAMDQFKTLWPEGYKGGLPVIFNFMDNGYGMGGRTNGETMAYGELARVGAGITPSQMLTERVDGVNPLAVIDAYRRKIQAIKENKGPVLLDVLTYRLGGHSTSDQNAYRTKEEIEALFSSESADEFDRRRESKQSSSAGASGVSSGIKLENVSKAYKGVTVLKDITWEVKKGEKVGLVGVNGAGKTTQMRIIAGLEEPDAGNVIKAKPNMKIAFLSQEFEVSMSRTVREEFLSAFREEMEVSAKLEKVQRALESTVDDLELMGRLLDEFDSLQRRAQAVNLDEVDSKVSKLMPELGFSPEDSERLVASFSSGWQMRMSLGKILLQV